MKGFAVSFWTIYVIFKFVVCHNFLEPNKKLYLFNKYAFNNIRVHIIVVRGIPTGVATKGLLHKRHTLQKTYSYKRHTLQKTYSYKRLTPQKTYSTTDLPLQKTYSTKDLHLLMLLI